VPPLPVEVPAAGGGTGSGSEDEGSTSAARGRFRVAREPRGEERPLLSEEEERPRPFASHVKVLCLVLVISDNT
jgi:hypothetical protein